MDGIRGFSLLGILLANLLVFQYGIYGKDELVFLNLSSNDTVGYYLIKVFIEESFMPIFAFIFGYSLILMKQSLERKGLGVKRHLFKRAIVLMGLGLLHVIFVWDGDILLTYGMMAIILLLFVNRKPKTLLIWGSILLSIIILPSIFVSGEDLELLDPNKKVAYLTEAAEVFSSGTYSEIMAFRSLDEAPLMLSEGEMIVILLLLPVMVLPMFLFGMYGAHKKWLIPSNRHKKGYLIGALLFIPLGLLLKTTMYLEGFGDFSISGGMILSIGYISLFALIYTKFMENRFIIAFEKVGKLSLTNYLLQSVICTFIFYGYGYGFFGRMGVIVAFVLGIAIFIIQVVGSSVYFYYFKQGPFEKLMSILIYFKFPWTKRKLKRLAKVSGE